MAYNKMNELKHKVPDWVRNGFKNKEDIDSIEHFGIYLADAKKNNYGVWKKGNNAISTSQIRIIYGEILRLKMQFNETAMLLLRPKIAYAASRNRGDAYRALQEVVKLAIDTVAESNDKQKAFANLASFFEAIIAYHKAHGGD